MFSVDKDEDYYEYIEQFRDYSEQELRNVTIENGYSKIEVEVVQDILNNKEQDKVERKTKERFINDRRTDPLYLDIHQMVKDMHFIRNVILFELLCGIVGA